MKITDLMQNQRAKNILWFSVATAIFTGLILVADPSKILSSLSDAELIYIPVAFLTGTMVVVCWSLNWHIFFKSLGINSSFFTTFRIFTAGQFFNNITPLGRFGGQPIMAYLISKKTNSTYEKSLATVMSADLVTVIPMSLYIITGLVFVLITGSLSQELARVSLSLLAFLCTGILIGFLAWFKPGTLEKYSLKLISKIIKITGRGRKLEKILKERIEDWEKALESIGNSPKTLIYSLGITGSAFLFRMITFYLVLTSLGLYIHPIKIMLLIPLISFASISPTPGGTGTYEAAMAGTLLLISDFTLATAVTATILYRTTTYWQGITIGYISTTTLGKIPETENIPKQVK